MKLVKLLLFLSFAGFAVQVAYADLVAPPVPYVVSSASGSHYFKMIPDKRNVWDKAKSKGILYEVRSGNDKVIYTVSGWYSYRVFISDDGKYLIRMGDWPSGSPKVDDLAIAFYVSGKESKRYNTLDMLKEPARVPRSISHYNWLDRVDASYMGTQMFSVLTVEKIMITFDITSGEIMFREPAKPASTK